MNQSSQSPAYKKVSAREKYAFGIGAIGKDAICNMVGSFLMLYFTDTLFLAPAFVGILFFAARIWDAFNDPMMGMIVDNTRSRFGKFRIWLIIGTLVNAVVFVLLFHTFNLQGTSLYIYVTVMYILYGMTYTIMDVPYWSWLPNLTNDPHERKPFPSSPGSLPPWQDSASPPSACLPLTGSTSGQGWTICTQSTVSRCLPS